MQTRCKYCQSNLEDTPLTNAEHVVACIEKDAAAVGTSAPPPAQPGASPGSMDMPADLGAQPSPLPSAPSRPGAGGSLSMDEPADLGAQPPPLPSAPSRPSGSSPLLGIEPAELSAQPSPLPSAPSRPSGSSSLLGIEPADLSAQPPPLPSASSTPGAGGSSSMDEPADLGAQPPLLPSAPSRRGESSSMDPEPAELRVQRLSSAPSGLDGSSSDGEEPDDMEEAKYHLAKMIALSGYDPSIVDDDCFRSFVKCLNPNFRVPSRDDIEAIVWPLLGHRSGDRRTPQFFQPADPATPAGRLPHDTGDDPGTPLDVNHVQSDAIEAFPAAGVHPSCEEQCPVAVSSVDLTTGQVQVGFVSPEEPPADMTLSTTTELEVAADVRSITLERYGAIHLEVGSEIEYLLAGKNVCDVALRPRLAKVQKRGSVERSIDITRYRGYDDLRHDLACMFGIQGQLEDPYRTDWKLVYFDHDDDMLLYGDEPWKEFVDCVKSIKILSSAEVQQISLGGDLLV